MNSLVNVDENVKKILIVEDDLSLRPFWERFFNLRLKNYQIDWAVSCEEAIKMTRNSNRLKRPYFLIVTDIFLAGSKTGMELLTSQEVRDSRAMTLLVSVADSDEILSSFGEVLSETTVISKPLDFRKLDSSLMKLINHKELQ